MVKGTDKRQLIRNKLDGEKCNEFGMIMIKKCLSVSETKRIS